ncbi:MAG: M20/M25/M40 family metallo-hydrolase [Kiritimatiellae bacterium]|nr:M20/M25/M40 family metallo-hydrolase [Kiritimatiellia bacterium]
MSRERRFRLSLENQRGHLTQLLSRLIQMDTTHGREAGIQQVLRPELDALGLETQFQEIPETLRSDPDYTAPETALPFAGRPNLFGFRRGLGGRGRSLILNTHVDVVPAAADWADAFSGRSEGDVVHGRGAVDCKGQIVTILAVLRALRDAHVTLDGELIVQFVVDEEQGGNGSLAAILHGPRADGVIVLEATQMLIHPANRGAVWFRATVEGKSVHMGRILEGVNAIEKACEMIRLMRGYEARLVADCAGHPMFQEYECPAQVNIGTMRAGDWPSAVAGFAVVEGGVGFLPNKQMEAVKRELYEAVLATDDEWLKTHFKLEFPKLHNDAYEIAADHPLPLTMQAGCGAVGLESRITGFIASCDARLFWRRGKMPVIVFGPGSISDAHSTHEHIRISDVLQAAEAMAEMVVRWCGES